MNSRRGSSIALTHSKLAMAVRVFGEATTVIAPGPVLCTSPPRSTISREAMASSTFAAGRSTAVLRSESAALSHHFRSGAAMRWLNGFISHHRMPRRLGIPASRRDVLAHILDATPSNTSTCYECPILRRFAAESHRAEDRARCHCGSIGGRETMARLHGTFLTT